MLKAHLRLEGIKDGFDDEALAQHDLVSHGHQAVPQVPADTRNEVQTALSECLKQVLTDIAFVGVELARQMPGHLIQHGAVGGVAGVIFKAMIWPLWLMTKCSLRPKNHPMLVLPRAAKPSKTLWRWMRRLWQTASLVESTK